MSDTGSYEYIVSGVTPMSSVVDSKNSFSLNDIKVFVHRGVRVRGDIGVFVECCASYLGDG